MKKKIAYYVLIGLLFILSFRLFSSLYYPALHSDNAITILMIHYFHLPGDLYYWGQDRMGSLIPLIGQIFFKGFHLSAITSEAITHYLLLLIGFLAFASFFKTRFYKVLFAIFWFFPPMRMIDLTQFSFGIHYGLIGMCCFLIQKKDEDWVLRSKVKYHLLLFLIVLLMIMAIWVSDMALISVFLLVAVQLYFYLKRQNFRKISFQKAEIYYTIGGILAGYFFISYAKGLTVYRTDYTVIGDINMISATVSCFLKSFFSTFIYNAAEPFTVVYSYMVTILIVFTAFHWKKVNLNEMMKKWLLFFLLDAIVMLLVILVTRYTFLNGVPRRYFVCFYVSFGTALLIFMENLAVTPKLQHTLKGLTLLTLLIGFTGMMYTLKYLEPRTFKPQAEVSREFRKLGKPGIIANYWNSYIISCVDPDNIKATQNDLAYVRNEILVDEVLARDDIYIIKNDWMEDFPDTLTQFGCALRKDGTPWQMGHRDICKYAKRKINITFPIENLFSKTASTIYDSAIQKKVFYVSSACDTCHNNYFVFGPYIGLPCGSYEAQFFMKADFVNLTRIALLDVVTDYGTKILAKKILWPVLLSPKGAYKYVNLAFTIDKRATNVEFRVFYYENGNLSFDHVTLKEK